MPPKRGESKQDFLGRCTRDLRAGGMSEAKAMSACALEWKQAELSAKAGAGRLRLSAPVELRLADAPEEGAERRPDRFAILAYTGKEVDWGYLGRFIISLKGMKLAKAKVPALYLHDESAIVGAIDKGAADESGFVVTGNFSEVAGSRGPEVLAHAREGFPWQASIGVVGRKVLSVRKGETYRVNGRTVDGPIDVWLESNVFEVSFVPFGADDDTAAIAMRADGPKTFSPEEPMPESVSAPLSAPDAPGRTASGDAGTGAAEPGIAVPSPAAPDAALATARNEAAKLARERASRDAVALLSHGRTLGLRLEDVQGVLAENLDLPAATEKLLELAQARNKPLGARLDVGLDEADKFRMAGRDGLLLRLGRPVEKPAPGARHFRGLTLSELAKDCLRRLGRETDGMTAARAAAEVIRLSAGPMSGSDFGAIAMDAVNVTLQKAYAQAPSTWRPWCGVESANDFKTIHGVALSEAPDYDLITEGGEYRSGSLKDKQESYHIGKYGKVIAITEEMIVNDDTRALTRLPAMFGAAAARKISEVVYGLVTSNPTMREDGKPLFSAAHGNLASGASAGGVTKDTLSAMRMAMQRQKGMRGAALSIVPRYLLVPFTYQTDAEILLTSAALPESGMSAGVKNVWAGKLVPIADAWLDAADQKAWYMVGDPAQIDTVEVSFLDGIETPTVTENEEFRRDQVAFKARIVFGAGVMDFRGLARNPGQA